MCFVFTVNEHFPNVGLVLDPQLDPPSDAQAQLLRMAILCGLGNHVARSVQHCFDEYRLVQ